MMVKKAHAYTQLDRQDDFSGVAKSMIDYASKHHIPVEENPQKAQHMIQSDLSTLLPPQLYALIGMVTQAVEALSEPPKRGAK